MDHPHILLLSLETLRRDHLGGCDHARQVMPSLDRLAERGVRFRDSVANCGWTLPQHMTLMTGLYPLTHAVTMFDSPPLSCKWRMLSEHLREHGVAEDAVDEMWVPGAFELPPAARAAAGTGRYDAVICLGAVIRGETPHFDYVAAEAARGIGRVSAETGVPAVFGGLTTDTVEQAMERAGGRSGNKGRDAALAGLEMASLLAKVREG